tara:strand:+ start:6218 stop:6478 length:261 start_codon:yes stop_codon:yes gene_type:complete
MVDKKRNTSPLSDGSGKVRITTIIAIYVEMLNDYIIEVGSSAHKRLKILQAKLNRGEIHLKPGKMTEIEKERARIYKENEEKNENR